MNNWSNIIQDCIYPPTCLLCGDPGFMQKDLCEPCLLSLPYNLSACARCGQSLTETGAASLCGRCQTKPPAYDKTFALFCYEQPVRHLILSLKFNKAYPCARLLGQLLSEALIGSSEKPELLIPIPLHKSRYRQRGFNQATEIARTVSKHLKIPLELNACKRALPTQPQTELPAKQRLKNIKNAFQIVKPIQAQHVAILDDVVTTGATVNELAKQLRKSGVKMIEIWAIARA